MTHRIVLPIIQPPPCRWRYMELNNGRYICGSPKMGAQLGSYGIEAEVCVGSGENACKVRDHEIPATLLQKARNFTKAAINHVIHGLPYADDQIQFQRKQVCNNCIYKTEGWSCEICGCSIKEKAAWKEQDCPICAACGHKQKDCKCEAFVSKWGPRLSLPTISADSKSNGNHGNGGCGHCGKQSNNQSQTQGSDQK